MKLSWPKDVRPIHPKMCSTNPETTPLHWGFEGAPATAFHVPPLSGKAQIPGVVDDPPPPRLSLRRALEIQRHKIAARKHCVFCSNIICQKTPGPPQFEAWDNLNNAYTCHSSSNSFTSISCTFTCGIICMCYKIPELLKLVDHNMQTYHTTLSAQNQ